MENILQNSQWITVSKDVESADVIQNISVNNFDNAKITIIGLGYFELYINGVLVSDDKFVPAYSDYHKRENMNLYYPITTEMDFRIYAVVYDISKYLNTGLNKVTVRLGSGYYRQTMRNCEGTLSYGKIKTCWSIMLDDKQEFCSDSSAIWKENFIKKTNLYFGETHNYIETCETYPVEVIESPKSEYCIANCPSDKIIRTVKPVKIAEINNMSIYDMGENSSGYAVLKSCGDKEIIVSYAENIYDDFSLDYVSCSGNQIQEDKFLNSEKGQALMPYFTWHGFRYFSVKGDAEVAECHIVHTDIKKTAKFSCDSDEINWIYDSYIRTQLSNIHSAVPSDCPHRERLGYTGDGLLTAGCVMRMFDTNDVRAFYDKWLLDIVDGQDKITGHIQHTAPFAGGGGGPSGWGGAIVIVPWEHYKHYADISVLEKYYDNMKLFIEYMYSRTLNGLISFEEPSGWCLGEWCAKDDIIIPPAFANTSMFIMILKLYKKISVLLNKLTDIEIIDIKIEEYQKAFKTAYSSAGTEIEEGQYFAGVQAANVFAYMSGLESQKLAENINNYYSKLGEFDTGIFGTPLLIKFLCENNYIQTAFELLTSHKKGSYYNMKKNGATTLWERWNGASNNHPMFGAIVRYFFDYILGIRQEKNSVGYSKTIIKPEFTKQIHSAKGEITNIKGKVAVEYCTKNETIEFNITTDYALKFIYLDKEYNLEKGSHKITF